MSMGPKTENRGGYRPGAGRPRGSGQTLSMRQVAHMLRKARRMAKAHGKDIDDILLSFIYDEDSKSADRVACIKLWKELTMAKIQEGGETDRFLAPAIFLPEQHPRLTTIDGGKSA